MAKFESTLIILQRLQKGPANRQELIQAVQAVIPDAYDAMNQEARDSSFERDIKKVAAYFTSQDL